MYCSSFIDAGWNVTDYTFRLGVSKGNRQVYYDQVVYVVAGFVPDISISYAFTITYAYMQLTTCPQGLDIINTIES